VDQSPWNFRRRGGRGTIIARMAPFVVPAGIARARNLWGLVPYDYRVPLCTG
jgi:hypothetical protein